ncbi:MAG: hypothetical protein NVV66_08315 [Cellulomonas sp.]|uniref:hypothetical protein n=1 Tax=Cellulomonas sp. TaxID=40001 RepID=UPI00258F7EA3|nr:hypothetical protein [Cellulomonas sp.]MCR6704687.1 hypothetical protein [Cellulomonas sp.]
MRQRPSVASSFSSWVRPSSGEQTGHDVHRVDDGERRQVGERLGGRDGGLRDRDVLVHDDGRRDRVGVDRAGRGAPSEGRDEGRDEQGRG